MGLAIIARLGGSSEDKNGQPCFGDPRSPYDYLDGRLSIFIKVSAAEEKIDFLEQITLFGKNPADVPQPWKARIWEKFLSKMHVVKDETNYIDLNNCPINFDCRSITGAQDVIFCPNKLQCKNLKRSL